MSMNNISNREIEEELKALANNKAVTILYSSKTTEIGKQGGDAMVDKPQSSPTEMIL